jgi:hypothetical protein
MSIHDYFIFMTFIMKIIFLNHQMLYYYFSNFFEMYMVNIIMCTCNMRSSIILDYTNCLMLEKKFIFVHLIK